MGGVRAVAAKAIHTEGEQHPPPGASSRTVRYPAKSTVTRRDSKEESTERAVAVRVTATIRREANTQELVERLLMKMWQRPAEIAKLLPDSQLIQKPGQDWQQSW